MTPYSSSLFNLFASASTMQRMSAAASSRTLRLRLQACRFTTTGPHGLLLTQDHKTRLLNPYLGVDTKKSGSMPDFTEHWGQDEFRYVGIGLIGGTGLAAVCAPLWITVPVTGFTLFYWFVGLRDTQQVGEHTCFPCALFGTPSCASIISGTEYWDRAGLEGVCTLYSV